MYGTEPDTEKLAAFMARVVVRPNGCWHFGKSRRGYATTKLFGRKNGAHRVSWEIHRGAIPEGLFVCHHCDNPPCVNPEHLFIGTVSDNAQDMLKKGRGRKVPQKSTCSAGHDLLLFGVPRSDKGSGRVRCGICLRQRKKEYEERNRERRREYMERYKPRRNELSRLRYAALREAKQV
jgi:hypothetical protein